MGDGSIRCVVRWEPSVVAETELVGALRERCKELFIDKYGAQAWEIQAAKQDAPDRGRRGKGKKTAHT
jgi:hypothetical protein